MFVFSRKSEYFYGAQSFAFEGDFVVSRTTWRSACGTRERVQQAGVAGFSETQHREYGARGNARGVGTAIYNHVDLQARITASRLKQIPRRGGAFPASAIRSDVLREKRSWRERHCLRRGHCRR